MIKFFNQKILTHYVSPEITVGFNQYGPTLTIKGVLSVKKEVMLIKSIGLSLAVPFHSLKKELEWFAFQLGTAKEASLGINIQPPSKFVLSAEQPREYTILFIDNQYYAEMKNILSNVSAAWEGLVEHTQTKNIQQMFEEFKNQTITRGLHDMLKKMCYWKTGRYLLTISVASKGDVFFVEKTFNLEEEHVTTLTNNSINILAVLCNQPSVIFTPVTVALDDI